MSKNTQKINKLEQLASSFKSDKQLQRISPESSIKRLSQDKYKSETHYFGESIKEAVDSEKSEITKEAVGWAKEQKDVDLGAFARGIKDATSIQEQGKTKENHHEF